MSVMILGLLLFLGVHSVRIVAEGWRVGIIARRGEGAWKGAYSLLSIAGLVLLVWGYGQARMSPQVLWASPIWTRHLAALLMLLSMVLLVAAYVPRNAVKARLHHPMVLGVAVWALAHLLANNTLADLLLFGSFLAWSVVDFGAARGRDRDSAVSYAAGSAAATVATLLIGLAVWGAIAFWAHMLLFGVRPFGA